jgi:hypothetical protein
VSTLLPEASYTAVAVAANVQWGETNNGNTQVVIPLRIVDGPHAGTVRTWFGFFTPKTEDRTMEALRYMGWVGDDLMNLGPLDQLVEIVIGHETYNGNTTDKVQWVNQIGGGKIKLNKPMDDSAIRLFAAGMKNKAKQIAAAPGEKYVPGERVDRGESQASAPSNGGGDDYFAGDPGPSDDLPF